MACLFFKSMEHWLMSVNAVTSRFGLGEKPLCLFLHKALTKNKIKMQIHLREHSCLSVNTVTDWRYEVHTSLQATRRGP